MRKLSTGILFFLLSLQVAAQQYNSWYFGNGVGLGFNAGGPTLPYVLTDGHNVLNEGSASISDATGKILFYTNGETVYNRLHQVMLNGNNLAGNVSAVQSSVIVPLPNNDSLYYLFTTDAIEHSFTNGYRYSIINVKRDGGNGEVATKDVLLNLSCSERLTAARHANGVDVWIIGNERNSNVFKAWLLSCTGLQTIPVVSAVGTVMTDDGVGMMKVSPDGSQVCQTSYQDITGIPFQLFDFNNATGLLSNARSISNPNNFYYGCEFSPDSRFLYVTLVSTPLIDQFETKLGSTAAINASRIGIPADPGFYGIQTGPDEKIYLNNHTSAISVINSPNVKGPGCTFQSDKISLGFINSGLGLPSAINDGPVDPYNDFTWQIIDSCNSTVQFFGQTNLGGAINWSWDFGDGTTSVLQNPQHTFSASLPYYNVKLMIRSVTSCGFSERAKVLAPAGLLVNPDFDFVSKCDSGYVRFINKSVISPADGTVQYEWDFGDGGTSSQMSPEHSYSGGGVFNVSLAIRTNKACLDRSAARTIDFQPLDIQVSPGQTIEAGQTVQLYVTGGATQFTWTPSKWLNDPTIANPLSLPQNNITYIVTATNDAGCTDVDSVSIHVNLMEGIYMPTGFTPGNDGLNDIIAPILSRHYKLESFTIYNRWGEKIFSTTQPGKGWDGRLKGRQQPAGVYVWIVTVKDVVNKIIEKKGALTLIR